MGWSEGELSLTFLGDRAMARLNRETFGRRGPTNVIAFPLEDMMGRGGQGPAAPAPSPQPSPPTPYRGCGGEFAGRVGDLLSPSPPLNSSSRQGPPPLWGEVVISIETTRRQARENGWPWRELLDFFLIHGILHLMGYVHEDPEGEVRMTAKTWELMRVLHPGIKED